MKQLIIVFCLLLSLSVSAQNAAQARKILDKTAALIANKKGATANFNIVGKNLNTSGTIAIKVINIGVILGIFIIAIIILFFCCFIFILYVK